MLSFYQHLPQNLSPIAISVGVFSVRWYSLMYLLGFVVVYFLLRYRARRGEGERLILNFKSCLPADRFSILKQFPNYNDSKLVQNSIRQPADKIQDLLLDWMAYSVAGLLVGGRLGYVLFYNLGYYLQNPLTIISPYDFSTGIWMGIFGMSYFGGVLGIVLASWVWVRKNKISFWAWADFVIPAVPAGYFFGRLGNFWNGELYGRITEKAWGMYFPIDFNLVLRHPSQLYEALFEGLVLFLILWPNRNKGHFDGQLLVIYFFGYGLFRFGIEFFRAPDAGATLFFNILTLGQIFSLSFMALALIFGGALSKRKKAL